MQEAITLVPPFHLIWNLIIWLFDKSLKETIIYYKEAHFWADSYRLKWYRLHLLRRFLFTHTFLIAIIITILIPLLVLSMLFTIIYIEWLPPWWHVKLRCNIYMYPISGIIVVLLRLWLFTNYFFKYFCGIKLSHLRPTVLVYLFMHLFLYFNRFIKIY